MRVMVLTTHGDVIVVRKATEKESGALHLLDPTEMGYMETDAALGQAIRERTVSIIDGTAETR